MKVEYRFRLHDGDPLTLADFRAGTGGTALEVTSIPGGTNPYIPEDGAPTGEGSELDPLTGSVSVGAYSGLIADVITAGTSRLFTSLLEDGDARDQLGDRWAAWDLREDGGAWENLITGFLTQYKLASDICWAVTVSDPFRVAQEYTAFAPQPTDTIETYLARWPRRGCVIGGPVIGGFLGVPDLGGIEVTAWEQYTDAECRIGPLGAGTMTHLAFKSGYVPPDLKRTTKASDVGDVANPASDRFKTATAALQPYFPTTLGRTFWPGLVHELTDQATGAKSYYSVDNGFWYKPTFYNGRTDLGIVVDKRSVSGLFVSGAITVNHAKVYRLRTIAIEPCDESPIYDTLHPVDWIARLLDEAGLAYDTASFEDVRDLLGADLRLSLRINEPKKLLAFLEETFLGPFGLAFRNTTTGELALFSTRIFTNAAPTIEITADDVEDGATSPFELRSETAIRKVVVECQQFAAPSATQGGGKPGGILLTVADHYAGFGAHAARPEKKPADGIELQDIRFERLNGDPGAVGRGEVTFRVPGVVHLKDGAGYDAMVAWVDATAREVFDRWGRGIREASTFLLATGAGAGVQLGEEILFGVPELPNHNKRLGDDLSVASRAVQVTRRTRRPGGLEVQLLDSGAGAQPLTTVPVLTIAASSANPRRVAQVTITNAATLNGLGYGVRLRMATTSGDDTAILAYEPGAIPTDPIDLPAVTAGSTVYASARSELAGYRPTNWSVPVSVALTGLTAPSGLTATPDASDGSRCALAWTVGESSLVTDVFLRLTADPAATAVRVQQLQPGSSRYVLEGLTPGASYTATVLHRDLATNDTSAAAAVAFTAGATVATLSAPGFETGFAGSWSRDGIWQQDGIYGIAVVATEFPAFVEVEEAVETAVGAGTYGAFASVGRVPSVLGAWTMWASTAPNDGLQRQLRARHVRDGATASGYTSTVTVTPWTASPLGPYPTQGYVRVTTLDPLPGEGGTHVRAEVEWVDPLGTAGEVQLVDYTSNTSIATGSAAGVWVASPDTWKFTRPTGGSGVGEARFAGRGDSGTDESVLTIPEVGSTQPVLKVDARIQTNGSGIVVYRVNVSHNGSSTVTVTLAVAVVGIFVSPSANQTFNVPAATTVYVDYTITLPNPGFDQGRAVWTATASGMVDGKDAANFGDQGQDAAGSLAVTFSTSGVPTLWLNGASNQVSWRYAWSTTSMPSDASAIAGTVLNQRSGTVNLGTTVAMGGRIYVKALPFTGASGTGLQGQIIAAEVERTDASTTKTYHVEPVELKPHSDTDTWDYGLFSTSVNNNVASGTSVLVCQPPIPRGCTINSFDMATFAAAGAWVQVDVWQGGFNLASALNSGGGAVTLSGVLGVSSNTPITFRVALVSSGGATSASVFGGNVYYDAGTLTASL